LHGARLDPGKRAALLLSLVAAIAAVAAAIGVWRDRPEPRPVESVAMMQVTDATASGPPRHGSTTTSLVGLATVARSTVTSPPVGVTGPIVVSVTGAVRKPGLVRLAAGSRVADAIAKAGGTTGGANITGLNLAEKLTDGASVVVSDAAGSASSVSSVIGDRGVDGQAPAATGSGTPAGKLDLNAADVAGLEALPGVGPVTAAAIVAWREKNGRFTSLEQLQEIQGIGPAKYAALAPLVKV
jgi:competence protein ComEA